ncbi:hypothetical protein EYC84_011579 [Monilinia fructicola]|uniref:Uncharacterized protein n=1 Tax=Monilinia fructicola TaxID=38448 RepID=A0A5M9J5J9_MONFR|nr:hypothetical protein EYC84_011579 [Monilinia fructicola]
MLPWPGNTITTMMDTIITEPSLKIRAIMKTKLIAIRSNKEIPENAFDVALSIPDFVEGKDGKKVHVPVPDMRLTDEEIEQLRKKGIISGMSGKGVRHIDSRSKRKQTGGAPADISTEDAIQMMDAWGEGEGEEEAEAEVEVEGYDDEDLEEHEEELVEAELGSEK